ncbi:hypothetical protein RND71_042442 [Anisodus tanguticus]|uniref:Uncharacterized protein n=1 Tax=Anisodus tanguticus TaxID=243964 RepID=A0AAE1QQN3_9SOLA|nr:hypothetical protein RND71_042442 [Anisodus tanguticus]
MRTDRFRKFSASEREDFLQLKRSEREDFLQLERSERVDVIQLERSERDRSEEAYWAFLERLAFSLGGKALSFSLRGLGCSGALALAIACLFIMVNLEVIFNYGGEWTFESMRGSITFGKVMILAIDEYCNNLDFIRVQQIIVATPCGNLYEIEGDSDIMRLLEMINDDYYVINLFATEDCELAVDVSNFLNYVETAEPNFETAELPWG